MKIKVKTNTINITIPFPLGLLKSKFVIEQINNNTKDLNLNPDIAKDVVDSIRKYIKENGHFTLCEVTTSENDHIVITI